MVATVSNGEVLRGAFAEVGDGPAPATSKGRERAWSIANSPVKAVTVTPSGVTVTITKTLRNGARITQADAFEVNPAAPDDEYLVPANAKGAPGISDLYEGFEVTPNDWNDVARLTFTFSQPVRNPRLHISGTGGATGDKSGNREDYWPGLEISAGTPVMPTFSNAAGFPGFKVTKREIVPASVARSKETTCGVVYMCGTARVDGTVSAFTVDMRARNVRKTRSAGQPFMWAAFRVTLEEDESDAPASYGAATHVVTDQFIGSGVSADNLTAVAFQPRRRTDADADSPFQPPSGALTPGGSLTLHVPVTGAGRGSAVAGWIDFNDNGRFEPGERAQSLVLPGLTRTALTWTVPRDVRSSASWLRLRMAGDPAELELPTGYASGGEVEDHPFAITASGLTITQSAPRDTAAKGERVTFVTTVGNPTELAQPARVAIGLRDVVDDARYRGASGGVTLTGKETLTWAGDLEPGEQKVIRAWFRVGGRESGNGELVANVTGSGVTQCRPGTLIQCGSKVKVKSGKARKSK
ncbi:hypothetical protein GCM10009560_25560 [Nonomuraea longicatena]|uniref:GEVED domain-containing protein n=1 Tax=Nonomuraea longicatena TaxID=83682 RepID=A0ABP3ZQ58_9ACTN